MPLVLISLGTTNQWLHNETMSIHQINISKFNRQFFFQNNRQIILISILCVQEHNSQPTCITGKLQNQNIHHSQQ